MTEAKPNKTISILFPGQGSQYPGMSKVLLGEFSWTRKLFEEASEAANENLVRLTLDGPEDKLQLTQNAQPAILTTSFAWLKVLEREFGFEPSAAAGHSLGEYTALLAAGTMTLAEAARLVRVRGELMQSAVPEGKGKMAAVLGLDDDQVIALCKAASLPDSVVVPANFNAPGQVVISGDRLAVERAEALAKNPEFPVRKMIPLKVSAPFHSPMMESMVEAFDPHLKSVAWQPMRFPVVFNVDATLRRHADIGSLLASQLYSPVLWTACSTELGRAIGPRFIEVGPGKVLTGLVKRTVSGAQLISIETLDDIKSFLIKWTGMDGNAMTRETI